MRGYTGRKDDIQRRLRRIEGQVQGLQRMVAEDRFHIQRKPRGDGRHVVLTYRPSRHCHA